ncbi:MAG: orotidine-5'-phosphate decarboxylase [Verrucomicrobiota bacterium]|nr:orotidine-5'-phosphate decarboxylase [Verrucomicrobiota bacterium]
MAFYTKLEQAWKASGSLVCVGLDPDIQKLPSASPKSPEGILAFNKAIIDATAEYACAFKPQAAYYHAASAEAELEQTIAYIRERAPHAVVILDAKRGDIGATAEQYAKEAFIRYGADAVTVNPYMGGDTLEPFLAYADRGVIVLCRTSNPGSGELQNLEVAATGKKVFQIVAEKCAGPWNTRQNVAIVVGATYPEELADIRQRVGTMPILVPGVGAQGGDLAAVLKCGLTPAGTGLLINASRSIIYASKGADFANAARKAAAELHSEIALLRSR